MHTDVVNRMFDYSNSIFLAPLLVALLEMNILVGLSRYVPRYNCSDLDMPET